MQFRVGVPKNQWRAEGVWGVQTPLPKFRSFDKAKPNSQFRGEYIHSNLLTIRVSLICKLSYRPQIPILSALCPQLNLLKASPRTKFLGTPLPKIRQLIKIKLTLYRGVME
jgi:hypothetical protein